MRIILDDIFLDNEKELMKKIGYFLFYDKKTKKFSYLRKLSRIQNYPRFHIFLNKENKKIIIDLHLDQKRPSYKGYKAHSGESDSQVVKNEAYRIKDVLINK